MRNEEKGGSRRAAEQDSGGVQSVDRAIAILEALGRRGSATVTDLAAELGVHKSTASRLVSSLEQRELVEQAGHRGPYRLGRGIVRLAGATSRQLDLVQEARPIARLLAAQTGETVNLAVLGHHAAVYVDQVVAPAQTAHYNWVGQHIPLHATSNGKVLLSELPEDEARALVGELTAYTEQTVTTRRRLRSQLQQVREAGYAVAHDELEVGLTAVAAPVRNLHGEICGSLSVSGRTFRLTPERVAEVVPLVIDAAADVSSRMGWQPVEAAPAGR